MYKYHTHVFLDHIIMQGSLTSESNTGLPHRLRPKGNSDIKAISEADARYNNTYICVIIQALQLLPLSWRDSLPG